MPSLQLTSFSLGPAVGLVASVILALLCVLVAALYRHRLFAALACFYLSLACYFLGQTYFGLQLGFKSILFWYHFVLLGLAWLPATWLWVITILTGRSRAWPLGLSVAFGLAASLALLAVDHQTILSGPLRYAVGLGMWRPRSTILRLLIAFFVLGMVMASLYLLGYGRRWRGPRPAYVRPLSLGLLFWLATGINDALLLAERTPLFGTTLIWLGSLVLSFSLAWAAAVYFKALQAELAQSEARYRQLVDSSRDAIVAVDQERRLISVNPAFETVYGYRAEEALGQSVKFLHLSEDLFEEMGRLAYPEIDKDGSWRGFWPYKRKDGQIIQVENTMAAYRLPNGRLGGYVSVTRDVTELRKAQVAIEEAHRRLRTILDCQDATIVVIDMVTLKVLFANARLRREVGFDPVGQVCWQALLPEQAGPCPFCNNSQLVDEAGQPTGICQWEWLNPRTNRWVSLRDQAIPWDDGRLVRFEIAYDIDDLKRTEEALRQSEERYRSLIVLSPVPILVHAEGRIVFANPAAERILMATWPDQLLGLPILELVHPSQRSLAAERIIRTVEGGRAVTPHEFDVLCLDGTNLVVESTGLPITFEGRHAVLTVWQDVTQRNRAMAELKVSEERYRNLLHVSPVATMVHRQGQIVYANPATEKILGAKEPGAILGRRLFDFALPEALPQIMERTRQIMDEGRLVPPQEFGVRRLDGTQVEVESAGSPIVYEGQPAVLVVWQDVTQRNRAIADLKASEERYRDLFNSITDVIFTLDLEGRFLSVNPALVKLLGCGLEEILGQTPADFMKPEFRGAFLNVFLPQIKTEGQAQGVTTYYAVDGSKRYIEYRNALVRPESGSPYISGIGRDVTERIQAERELRRLQEQLLQSQKLEAVGTLAGGVAHDFNNILQVLSGYLQLLEADPDLPAVSRKAAAEMAAAVDRAAELVRRLLAFSRKEKREVKPLNLNAEVSQAVKILGRLMPKMIRLETDLAPELGLINGSSTQMEQVLLNLAANARDAMPEGGVLTFTTRDVRVDEAQARTEVGLPAGEYVLLTVADTGQGMDQTTLTHLFEPFFTTKGVGQGTGLGLSTVYGIVKDHGGHVTCRSQMGQGTAFAIYFPHLQASPIDRSVAPEAEEIPGGGETILVVDDEPAIREVAAETLGQAGYTVLVAASGEEALEVQGRRGADLIIMDLGMPGMGGLRCIRELKNRDPRVRVLVASGYAAMTQIQASLEVGAQGYVSKPYRLKEMLRQVREVLDQKG